MVNRIKELLSEIEDTELKNKYEQIIFTLLEKGYFPGLAGIPVIKSAISHINGEKGLLTYRGYPVQELAENFSYEDICYLLIHGDLPLHKERIKLREELMKNKDIDTNVGRVILEMDKDLHPMYMMSAGVLLLQANDPDCFHVDSYNINVQRGLKLISELPGIIGIFLNREIDFAKGKDFDSFAQYCLYVFNQEFAFEEFWVKIFEKILILHADHTMNNSTFSVRAVASSKASIYASIASAINSLSGPLHGGANERVINMLEEIALPDNVENYINSKLAKKEKIMGIGHRIYKTYDPRSLYLKNEILPLIFSNEQKIDSSLYEFYEIAKRIEEIVLDRFSGKGIYPNVDFWSGLALKAMGIEPVYFTTIFALGRIMGWVSHWIEHMEIKNRIFRPEQLYNGMNTRHILVEPGEETAVSGEATND